MPVRQSVVWGLALALLASSAVAQQGGWQTTTTTASGNILDGSDISVEKPKLEDLMNFRACVKQKFGVCITTKCGKKPFVGLKATYYEPAAIVETTCSHGRSIIMEGGGIVGSGIGKVLFGAVGKAADSQYCQKSGNTKTQGQQTQSFYNTHVWGITPLARLWAAKDNGSETVKAIYTLMCSPGRLAGKGGIAGFVNRAKALASTSSIPQMATGGVAAQLPWGLSPAYISDIDIPAWRAGGILDKGVGGVLGGITAAPGGGALGSIACQLRAAGQDAAGILGNLGVGNVMPDLSNGFLDEVCVGSWGMLNPMSGYTSHSLPPVAAALTGYRGYKKALGLQIPQFQGPGSVLANTKGTQQFNLDYPFINADPFNKLSGSGHKGSKCYNVGTALPNWYHRGETFITNPVSVLADLLNPSKYIPGKEMGTENGDQVLTMWKKTSCCIDLRCWGVKTYY